MLELCCFAFLAFLFLPLNCSVSSFKFSVCPVKIFSFSCEVLCLVFQVFYFLCGVFCFVFELRCFCVSGERHHREGIGRENLWGGIGRENLKG